MKRTPGIAIAARSLDDLAGVVDAGIVADTARTLQRLTGQLSGRTVWNVNSTARGGGVAELLQSLLAYLEGGGIAAKWVTVEGDAAFFRITKRLHNAIHGSTGDGSELGAAERQHYESVARFNAARLAGLPRPDDIVILHDPQTAGLIEAFRARGCQVIWRCHIGLDHETPESRLGWAFLRPYLSDAGAFVFSRAQYVPGFLPPERCVVIPPSIDPLSPKNRPLDPGVVRAILAHTGLIEGPDHAGALRTFRREDGRTGVVERRVSVLRDGAAPRFDEPLIVQISRWDELKDPLGVMRGFAPLANGDGRTAHLVLAGPDVCAVDDDPEGAAVYDRVVSAWQVLPPKIRRRVHLANLPMEDLEENATIVNALQRHARVVVQKSLQEGFGLTVTEAMGKARPVVASRVGGIQDQIVDEESGLLIDDATDLDAFTGALRRLLDDPALAGRLAKNAHRRVQDRFLCNRHFREYAELLTRLDGEAAGEAASEAAGE